MDPSKRASDSERNTKTMYSPFFRIPGNGYSPENL